MKKIFMAVLLSVVSWAGAALAAETTVSRQSGAPVAQQIGFVPRAQLEDFIRTPDRQA